MEHQWAENYRTVDGSILHEKAHGGGTESRGDLLIVRAMRIHSTVLGVSGECDVVEFHRSENGVALQGRDGLWSPFPVEYKRDKPKPHDADELQLCAQAMCLEEMLCCQISDGALFYSEPRRRTPVEFTDELRQRVRDSLAEMHDYLRRGCTPKKTAEKLLGLLAQGIVFARADEGKICLRRSWARAQNARERGLKFDFRQLIDLALRRSLHGSVD